ncbi:MAG: hypothetical protein JST42_04475 [Bacteroidetes bacterium]|nr:hypothetical protein [Bacteroidota bacterium]
MKQLLFLSSLLFLVVSVVGQGPVVDNRSHFVSAAQPGVDKARVMEYFQEQDYGAAIDYLRPALEADPANVLLLGWAGYAWYMSDRLRESEDCYRRVLRVDSGNVGALHYLLLIGDSVSVEMDYARRLVALQPRKSAWWRIMGGLWAKEGKADSAFGCYARAFALAPGDGRAVVAYADALIDRRGFAAADTILDSALVVDSLNVSLLKLRIRSAYMAQDYGTVAIPGERLVRSGDPSVVALTQVALAYYNSQSYKDCIRVCEHMLDLGLQLESVYYYAARACTKIGEYDRSNVLLNLALAKAISATAEWYFDARSDNFEALKEYKQALANIDTAYYLFKDPLTLYNCGRLAETGIRDLGLARRYYRRYLLLARPKTAEEKRAYGYVKRRWGGGK